jgi:hypothetical protein
LAQEKAAAAHSRDQNGTSKNKNKIEPYFDSILMIIFVLGSQFRTPLQTGLNALAPNSFLTKLKDYEKGLCKYPLVINLGLLFFRAKVGT